MLNVISVFRITMDFSIKLTPARQIQMSSWLVLSF